MPLLPLLLGGQRCSPGILPMKVFPLNLPGGMPDVQENPLRWALVLSPSLPFPRPQLLMNKVPNVSITVCVCVLCHCQRGTPFLLTSLS